ncbi:hypothetical protein SPW_3905 [Streptomyces sp. W007]|nr:hypothetical protein SPW_3905 [Streptomyces sp. W007]
MPVGRTGSRRTAEVSTPYDAIVSTRWSPKPSAPTRPTQAARCPAAASAQATLDSAPPIPRPNEGTSARRPGCEGRNVTMDSPRQTTSVVVAASAVPAAGPDTEGSSLIGVRAGGHH